MNDKILFLFDAQPQTAYNVANVALIIVLTIIVLRFFDIDVIGSIVGFFKGLFQ